jgi:hypothetical protein
MTWGGCVAAEAAYIASIAIAYCYVQDTRGQQAMLKVTVAFGDGYGSPGADILAGPMFANGTIADQAGAFTFVSVSGGVYGFAGGGSYAWGEGSACNCDVKTVFVGGGVGVPGVSVTFGRSCTEVAWITDGPANIAPC